MKRLRFSIILLIISIFNISYIENVTAQDQVWTEIPNTDIEIGVDTINNKGKVWNEIPTSELQVDVDTNLSKEKIVDFVKNKVIDFISKKLNAEKYITQLHQDLSAVVGDINTYLDDIGITVKTGKLGIPNLQEAKIIFDEEVILGELNDVVGSQTGSTYSSREKFYQQYLRSLTQEYSENTALSLQGQSKLEAKVDSATSSAEQSLTIADDSSNQDISQNILRNISNQLALDQQTNAMTIADMQDAKIDRSLGLQLDSEILMESSRANMREERIGTATNLAAQQSLFMISIPGQQPNTEK